MSEIDYYASIRAVLAEMRTRTSFVPLDVAWAETVLVERREYVWEEPPSELAIQCEEAEAILAAASQGLDPDPRALVLAARDIAYSSDEADARRAIDLFRRAASARPNDDELGYELARATWRRAETWPSLEAAKDAFWTLHRALKRMSTSETLREMYPVAATAYFNELREALRTATPLDRDTLRVEYGCVLVLDLAQRLAATELTNEEIRARLHRMELTAYTDPVLRELEARGMVSTTQSGIVIIGSG